MAQMQIRGSTQIMDGTINAAKLDPASLIPNSQLVDGANFVKRDGSVPFTAAQSMGNNLLTNVADPVSAQDGVNLRTAQALINGVSVKRARLTTATNQALTGAPTIDGVATAAGNVVLLTGQSTASQNGPWVIAAGAWTRPTDWAAASSQQSTMWFVAEGTVNHDTKWIAITDAITVDTTSVTITQDQSGISYTNGTGISLTGNVFAAKLGNGVNLDGTSSIQVLANGASLNVSASGVKIADGTAGQLMVAGAAGAAAFTTLSGDATLSSGGALTINNTGATGFAKKGDRVVRETPTGAVNGANTTFTLAIAPLAGSEEVFLNGLLQEPGAGNDYTISGATITFITAPKSTPAPADRVRVSYVKA